MFKIDLENRDFRKSLYFYIVDAEKKRAASGCWHYIKSRANILHCTCVSSYLVEPLNELTLIYKLWGEAADISRFISASESFDDSIRWIGLPMTG